MMLSLTILSASIVLTRAALPKFHDSRNLSPDQFGLYHTDAFDRLGEKMTLYPPSDKEGAMQQLEDILSSYCFDDNEECMLNAHRSIVQTEDLSLNFADTQKLENLDTSIKLYLDSVYAEILSIESKGFERVMESLLSIENEMNGMRGINEEDKRLGLAATSIAIESTKLWNRVLSDTDHPLHLLQNVSNLAAKNNNLRHRNLQASIENIMGVDIAVIILIDFIACLACYGNVFVAIGASFFAFLISLDPEKPELTVPSFFGCVDSIFFPNLPNVAPFFPVMSPTAAPTMFPTVSSGPSGLPSQSPAPSSSPSMSSSTSTQPSASTSSPSMAPSVSLQPSMSPSTSPSKSAVPSASPTANPSISAQPTSSTSNPSMAPSKSPQPSSSPSSSPSKSSVPSVSPTANPSISTQPSMSPSISPVPSYRPTLFGE